MWQTVIPMWHTVFKAYVPLNSRHINVLRIAHDHCALFFIEYSQDAKKVYCPIYIYIYLYIDIVLTNRIVRSQMTANLYIYEHQYCQAGLHSSTGTRGYFL